MYHIHERIIFTVLAVCSFYASAASSEYNVLQHGGNKKHHNIKLPKMEQQQQQILTSSSRIDQSSRNLKRNDDDVVEDDDDGESSSSSDDNKKGHIDKNTQKDNKEQQQQYAMKNLESCTPISQCELCHGGKRGGHSGCSDTGRRIKMKCLSPETDSKEEVTLFTSCNRTSMDEEYLLVQFQALCVFIAFVSLRSVKREKVATISLFDVRSKRIRQEMVPLNSNNINGNDRSDLV